MKISIVTPSFNQGKYFQKCIESIKAQACNAIEIEHIVLDNCSTDATGDILRSYQANPGLVNLVAIIEPDRGQTEAINRGFLLGSGDIFCWLNTDEYYKPSTLATVARFFEEHPDIDVIFGDCEFVDGDGNLVKTKREYFFSISMLVYYGCYLPSCTTFVRRRVIDAGLLLAPEFRVTMDFDWYVRIAKAGYRIAHIPQVLASFTWHDTNISSVQVERRRVERRLVQDRYSGIPKPAWLRTVVYGAMLRFWLAVRVTRRFFG